MSASRGHGPPRRRRVERYRRPLVAGYLAGLALVCLTVLLPPLRGAMAGTIERFVDLRTEAELARIDEAEALVAAGRFEEAVPLLERLDRDFPARTRVHALDRDRERILHALGAAYRGLDRKGSALDAYRRAVLFDPLNVANRYALAETAIAFDEPGEAAEQLQAILDTYPPHAGATRALIALRFDDSDYEGVRALFARYVDAFRVHSFLAVAGDAREVVHVAVDGRPHEIEVPIPPGAARIELLPTYPTVEVGAATWRGRPRAGEPGTRAGRAPTLPTGPDGGPAFAPGPDAAALEVVLRAGIPLDTATWERVETAYRNLLRSDELTRLRPRLALVAAGVWDAARTEAP